MFKTARMVQVVLLAIVAGVSCNETTGPKTIDPPTGLSALLISPSSARITWTASAQSGRVASYNVFRNGAKIAEVQATSHVDEDLVELTSYRYTVSANSRDGIVSALSAESSSATVTPPDVTGPRVAAMTPAAASAVPRATTLRVTFSEAMTPSTINTSTFVVRTSSGSDIAGTVTYLPASASAEFVPVVMLPNATGIVVTITTGVRDQAGNAMAAPFGFAFAVRDEIAPSVLSVTPADLATGVSIAASPVIEFSEPMDSATINTSSVTIRLTGTGAAVSGSVSYNSVSRVAIFVPAAPLEPGSSFTIGVSTMARDASGNALAQAFASSFATEVVAPPPPPPPPSPPAAPPIDDVAPFVVSSTPANDSENMPVTSAVSVTFNEAMNFSTINGSTFTLEVAGVPVSGTATYDVSSRVASFLPTGGLLAEGQSYVATVARGASDVAGNGLDSAFVFAFTTAGPVNNTPPGKGNAFVWVMVINETGACIPGATIRVVQGQRTGETVTQKTPCTMWEDDGGFIFRELVGGSEMTLRASAPGYGVGEKKVVPSSGPQMSTLIVLSRK